MTDVSTAPRADTMQTQATLTERVRAILPEIAGRVAETEQQRSLPAASIDALRRAGVFRSLVPKRHGGDEIEFWDFLQAVRLLSATCVSSGWLAGVLGTHSHGVTFYDKAAQDEVWAGGPDTIICASFAAVVTAKPIEGGYRLSGHWDFASGCDHAAWAALGFRVEGRPPEESYLGLVPRSDFQVIDNWDTVGMRGTGSKRIVVSDVFVPDYRCRGPGIMAPPRAPGLHDSYLFNIPFIATATNFSAVILGAADGAIAAYTEAVQNRVRPHTGKMRLENPMAYVRLAESALDVRAAGMMIERYWQAIIDQAKTGAPPTLEEALSSRGDEPYAARLVVQAIDRLMNAGGGSAAYMSRPLQRYWRDLHTAGNHMYFDLENRLVIVGRHLVGLPPDPDLL